MKRKAGGGGGVTTQNRNCPDNCQALLEKNYQCIISIRKSESYSIIGNSMHFFTVINLSESAKGPQS